MGNKQRANRPEAAEELERFVELALRLERVAHVVPQLGVVAVDAKSGQEDLRLVLPVQVPGEGLEGVNGDQKVEKTIQSFLPEEVFARQHREPEAHEEAEAHGREVEDPLCDDEPDGEEEVRGREKRNHDERDAQQDDVAAASHDADDDDVERRDDENDGRQVSGIGERRDEGNRTHGPVAAEVAR